MRFPVFLFLLISCSLAAGLLSWLLGASIGTSLAWALGMFLAGQVFYVLSIGISAMCQSRSSRQIPPERTANGKSGAAGPVSLAAQHDQQG